MSTINLIRLTQIINIYLELKILYHENKMEINIKNI